ncbi:MAG TPA: hypothetical protein VFX48_01025 [Saprospiraceae bacterium]|nr:hypothetical protein [Saprospiraceae bacterium]
MNRKIGFFIGVEQQYNIECFGAPEGPLSWTKGAYHAIARSPIRKAAQAHGYGVFKSA